MKTFITSAIFMAITAAASAQGFTSDSVDQTVVQATVAPGSTGDFNNISPLLIALAIMMIAAALSNSGQKPGGNSGGVVVQPGDTLVPG